MFDIVLSIGKTADTENVLINAICPTGLKSYVYNVIATA